MFDRYLSQLRLLATGYPSFPLELKRDMSRASFLLGLKKLPAKTLDQTTSEKTPISDEDGQVEFVLTRASDLAIVDDSYLAKLFADAFVGAPEVSFCHTVDYHIVLSLGRSAGNPS